jgi:hypothetical protein
MRTKAAALGVGVAIAATWSLEASAQLQPPTPLLPPPPGWNAQPAYVPPQQPSATQQQLNASDNAKSFRRFELVYLNAEAGGGYVNIGDKFHVSGSQGGAMFGLGAGIRFLFLTLGARARIAPLSAFSLIEVNAELGAHLPLGAWDPYFNIHGGYVDAVANSTSLTFAGIASASVTPPSPNGGDFGGSIGADHYLSSSFSLGLDVSVDALFLSSSDWVINRLLIAPGESSTGVAVLGSVHAGLHFDL